MTNDDQAETIRFLQAEIARRDLEIRLLTVSHGATFEELERAGKVGTGAPYTFEELLAIPDSTSPPTAPPLVFIHILKTGGTTLNHILMKNYRFRLDSYGPNFFPRFYPDEFVSLCRPPNADDTRRPVFFTGHIDLANDIFRYMPTRHIAITLLRDPLQRIVSHYRYHSTRTDSFLHKEIREGCLSLANYCQRFEHLLPHQYALFSPAKLDVNDALHNLEHKVSFFGLQSRFAEFSEMLTALAGLPDTTYRSLNRTPKDAVDVPQDQIAEVRALLEKDFAFYEAAVELYLRRQPSLHGRKEIRHPWSPFYASGPEV